MTNTKPQDVPEAPAVIQSDHVQDRYLDKAGDRRGWRRVTPSEKAFSLGHLAARENCKDKNSELFKQEVERALNRRAAWDEFTEKWLICQASFPASDYNRIRAAGIPGSFADHQIDTKRFMRALESRLGVRDWMIARRVCGEGWPIAKVVGEISPSYRFSTLARFRECMDALIEALDSVRRG